MAEPTSPTLYPVSRDGRGALALMAAPRPGAELAADVAALVEAGVTDVVCLLPDDELARLGLTAEPEVVAGHGLRLHRLPTPDFGLPDASEAAALAAALADRFDDGASVVVHCRGGIGRSSTLAAIVLMNEGMAERQVWKVLSRARGRRVPETGMQRRFAAQVAGQTAPGSPIAVQVGEAIGLKLAALVSGRIGARRSRRSDGSGS